MHERRRTSIDEQLSCLTFLFELLRCVFRLRLTKCGRNPVETLDDQISIQFRQTRGQIGMATGKRSNDIVNNDMSSHSDRT
jgi:hypothetical protein